VLKFIHLIEKTELVGGETCVTVCIAVRGIQRGKNDRGTERERKSKRRIEGGKQ
jgi:hypothetical protein